MPKKAVGLFFLLAFLGAALFVYFTFPRTKDEIPRSNNQQRFMPTPGPNTPNTPNGVPVPETVPHPNTPKVPPGPTLHVMAWASAADARRLSATADAFVAATGREVALTIAGDPVTYRHDLQQALASDTPPDLCLVSSRDFCGLNPAQDLADAKPLDVTPPRAVEAFTVDGKVKAVPDEFTVEVLFYNPALFDQAGIGYPGPHWTWDVLEGDARALTALKLKDSAGKAAYALEMPASFDMWNILCAEAGAPVLDLDAWHLADSHAKDAEMRGLQLLHELFQEYAITPPVGKGASTGLLFAQQRVALMIASSDTGAALPTSFHYGMTVLPRDLAPSTLATVNGWAVPAKSTQADAAQALAKYLSYQPVHSAWTPILPPPAGADEDSPAVVCQQALSRAVIPRLDAPSLRMAQFLDQQLSALVHNPAQTPEILYAKIHGQPQAPASSAVIRNGRPPATASQPIPKAEASSQLQGL